jgi:hypothetical protein
MKAAGSAENRNYLRLRCTRLTRPKYMIAVT